MTDKPEPYVGRVPAGRAIVIKDGCVLVMKRSKPDGRKYMVTPGGRLEAGETPEQAVIREVEEETTIKIADPRLVFVEEPDDPVWGTQYVFLCEYVSGEPVLNPLSEEYEFQSLGGGTYEPLWLPFNKLDDKEYPFRSAWLGEALRSAIKNGFPDEPIHWPLKRV